MAQRITDDHVKHWRTHGFVIVERFLDPDELTRAREELYKIFPTAEAYAADPATYPHIENPEFGKSQTWSEFPFPGAPLLNRVSTHPEILSFVQRALGQPDLFLTQ